MEHISKHLRKQPRSDRPKCSNSTNPLPLPQIGPQSKQKTSSEKQDRRVITRLFAVFHSRYGAKWDSKLPTPEQAEVAMLVWSGELAGLSPEAIKQGLDSWDHDWPPDNALQFRKACRPKMPPAADLLREAVAGSTPRGKWVRSRIGSWEIDHLPEHELLKRVSAIERELEAYLGQPVTDAPQIEDQKKPNKRWDPEKGREATKKMRTILTGEKRCEPNDENRSTPKA